jgi:hypothetical protein
MGNACVLYFPMTERNHGNILDIKQNVRKIIVTLLHNFSIYENEVQKPIYQKQNRY